MKWKGMRATSIAIWIIVWCGFMLMRQQSWNLFCSTVMCNHLFLITQLFSPATLNEKHLPFCTTNVTRQWHPLLKPLWTILNKSHNCSCLSVCKQHNGLPYSSVRMRWVFFHLVTKAEMISVMSELSLFSRSSMGPGRGSCWVRCSQRRICCRFVQIRSASFSHLKIRGYGHNMLDTFIRTTIPSTYTSVDEDNIHNKTLKKFVFFDSQT